MVDKRGVIKADIFSSLSLVVVLLIFLIVLLSPASHAIIQKSSFFAGENVKIDLEDIENYKLKVTTPSTTYLIEGSNEVFSFKPEETGIYKLELRYENVKEDYEFEVVSLEEDIDIEEVIDEEVEEPESTSEDFVEEVDDVVEDEEIVVADEKEIEEEKEQRIVINEPVKWVKKEVIPEEFDIARFEIPVQAESLKVYTVKSTGKTEINFERKKNFFRNTFARIVSLNENFGEDTVIVKDFSGEIELEYFTEAPKAEETQISQKKKEVKISSPDGLHYENILAYSDIFEVSDKEQIRIYWKEEKQYMDFLAFDTDQDGLLDRVEWTVPHLSEQTFEIIVIVGAEHLDENRELIENVFEQVNERDDIWTDEITPGHYVRVEFEKNLSSGNDITIYARSNYAGASVEVYEKDGEEVIANFGEISEDKEYKIFLDNLEGEQDIFDLKITGNPIEFDLIIDPNITADTDPGLDIALTTLDNETFVVAWVDDTNTDFFFQVLNTNGSNVSGPVSIATDADGTGSRISVAAINSTTFAVAWTDNGDGSGNGEDAVAAWYDRNGNNALAAHEVDSDLGNSGANYRTDISVAVHSDRYYVCHMDDQDNDLDAASYSFSTPSTNDGDIQIEAGAGPAGTEGLPFSECVTVNSSMLVGAYHDDGGGGCGDADSIVYGTFQSAGTISTCNVLDSDVGAGGTDEAVAATGLNQDLFAVLWTDRDGADANSVELQVLNSLGTTISGPTAIDSNFGNVDTTLALATVRNDTDSSQDYFIAAWNDRNAGDIRGILYNSSGSQVEGPFVLANDESATYLNFDIYGKDHVNDIGICPGTFVFAYTNSSDDVSVKTFYINGTEWSGQCGTAGPDITSPDVTINFPTNSSYATTDFPLNFNVTLNENGSVLYSLDFGVNNITMTGNEGGVFGIEFNATNSSIATGSYLFEVYANDTTGNTNYTESVAFSVFETGDITVDLIDPNENANVNPGEFFNFTAQINCVDGACGNINATLDPVTWWNTTYLHRREINVTNAGANVIEQNYSMMILVNTSIAEGFEANGNDLRIVFFDGSTNIELDRYNETAFNSDSTQIWFRIQEDIASGSSDANYYVYYNASSPGTAPSNGSNVFEFFDDFDRANSATIGNGWTEESGTWDITSNRARQSSGGHSDMSRSTTTHNHSVRMIANHENSDADWKAVGRAATASSAYAFGYQNGQNELGSSAHNSGNLCNSAFTATTGTDYEVELHMFGTRILGYVDDTLYCNVTSTTHDSGDTWIHAWDISQYDDFWVRKFVETEPNFTLGSEEDTNKGGIIPMFSGNPFYTITLNPNDYTNTSCLGDLQSGESCNVTWQVNATGAVGSTWEFFVIANSTNYTDINNVSSKINITIGNLAPSVPELDLPINKSVFGTFTEFNWSNSSDSTGDSIEYVLEISNQSDFSSYVYQNNNIVETENPTGDLPTGITGENQYYWRVLATDLKDNSSYTDTRTFYYDLFAPNVTLIDPPNNTENSTSNSLDFLYNVTDLTNVTSCSLIINDATNVTDSGITKEVAQTLTTTLSNAVYTWSVNCTDELGQVGASETRTMNVSVGNNPPVAHELECEESGSFSQCNNLGFGDNVTRFRLRCTDPESGVTNVTFNFTNDPDSHLFFSNTTNTSSGDYWIFDNEDIIINDSGNFTLHSTCFDNEDRTSINTTTWLVPWGNFTIDLIDPSSNANVLKGEFFNFTAQINCVGGECGNINATLDPATWWNNTYLHRREINVTNAGGAVIEQNYSMMVIVNTSLAEGYHANGDDFRLIYYNGSTNIELDRYNETAFNSDSTQIWFRIQEDIASGSSDANYYVYYNASSPGTAPSNGSNVFEFFDDFDRANSATIGNGWTEESGTWDITSNRARQSSGGHSDMSRSTTTHNHSVRMIANHENSDADWKAVGRAATASSAYAFGYQNGQNELGSSAHNSGNLCNSAFTATTGTDYEVELHMFGTRILGYVDDTLYCNVTSTTHDSGDTWIHAWDISQYDDFWVRKFVETEPNFTLGAEENSDKGGIIPMFSGNPFYTITLNPNDYTNTSCLGDLRADSCNVTWQVNATGDADTTWEFFVISNSTNYTNWFTGGSNSDRINITIVSEIAPTIPQLNAPANLSASANFIEFNWTNSTDANGDTVSYYFQVDNNSDFSSPEYTNSTIAETESPTGDTPSGIVAEGTYYWRVLATDGALNSSFSETRVFFYDLSAPTITFINQTGEDFLLVNDTHPLDEGENITINVDVTDTNVVAVWVVIWETIKGSSILFSGFLSNIIGDLWTIDIPTNFSWGTDLNYTIYANDSLNQTSEFDGNFTILKGDTTINLAPNPVTSATNVTVYGHVNLTNGSDLGNYAINIWLNDTLLLLANVTPNGVYDNHLEFNDTTSAEFNKGTFFQTSTDGENITLASGNTSGNFTKILDAGARVEWNNIIWTAETAFACSATVTHQEEDANSYSGTEDTYISSGTATTNYGEETSLIVDGSPTDRGLVKFNNIIGTAFNQIPENSTITAANITFSVTDTGNIVTVYEILENWTEDQATYNNRLTGTAWSSAGLGGSPSRSSTSEDTFTASSVGNYTVNIANAVRRWTNGTSENYGVVLDMSTSNGISIISSNNSLQIERPVLNVQYSSSECSSVTVYTRTSNDKENWSDWTLVSNGDAITDNSEASRFLEYRAELTSTTSSISPVLGEVSANYTAITTNSSGDYSYNFSNPTDFGDYPIIVNTSLRTILINNTATLTVQTGVAPNVSLVSPDNNTWFNYGNLTLIYNATDDNNNFANSTLIINGEINQTNSSAILNGENNNFTINFTSGQYNWTVNVTDTTNLMATDVERIFWIDLEDPNLTLVYPANESVFTISDVNLSFNVTDNLDPTLACNITLDGSVIHSDIAVNSGDTANRSSGSLTNGLHYWNVTCTDESTRSVTSETRVINISDIPPQVILLTPLNDATDDNGEIQFVFNATDNNGFTNATLVLNDVLDTVNQTTITNGGNTTITRTSLAEGSYNWTILAIDTGGLTAQPEVRNFTVDLTPPNITLNRPLNGSTSSNSDLSFNFTAVDTIDTSLTCNLTIAGSIVDSNFAAVNGSLTNRDITDLTDGVKLWNVTCFDDAGHQNTSDTFTVSIAEPPFVTLNVTNATSFMSQPFNLTYTPIDNTNLSACDLYINGALDQTNSSAITNGALNYFNVSGLSDGTYNWTVNCTDYFSQSFQAEERTFFVDSGAPNITLLYPNGQEIGENDIEFNFSVVDTIDTSFTCNITVDAAVVDSNFTALNGTVTNRTISGILDGFHTWHANCTDSAENTGNSLIYNFTKSTPPTVNLTQPQDGKWFNTGNFNLTYFPLDDEGFNESVLYINGLINSTNTTEIVNNDENNFTLSNFSDGEYNWTVKVEDIRGLNATASPNRTFYVDTQNPGLVLNSPGNNSLITTNNVSFNFTAFDNLDSLLSCQLELDGEIEYDNNSTNGTDVVNYILVGDGIHLWNVTCTDEATNLNSSAVFNFTVEAPPNVTLIELNESAYVNTVNTTFVYLPEDPLGLANCSILIDDVINSTDTAIEANQNNNFTIQGIEEGVHNWTVQCFDAAPDFNLFVSDARNFTIDRTAPSIALNSPLNNSNALKTTTFNFTTFDNLDDASTCDLYIDGTANVTGINVLNGTVSSNIVSGLSLGAHVWNVTCVDNATNSDWSETWDFNVTLADLSINTTDIVFNNTSPVENETIRINATVHNLIDVNVESLIVQFFDGDPKVNGAQIGANQSISLLSGLGQETVSVNWEAGVGSTEIFVQVDPNITTSGLIEEWDENNNEANSTITIGAWHFVYGSIDSLSELDLADAVNNSVLRWDSDNFEYGNIYAADLESDISWLDLQAIGQDDLDADVSNDLQDADLLLNMTSFADSVNITFTNGSGSYNNLSTITVFNKIIDEVPVANSTNNTNFVTGMLWDTSDDPGGQYSRTDAEDLVFVAPINKNQEGAYGLYDYEIRIPARLRQYIDTEVLQIVFYTEIR